MPSKEIMFRVIIRLRHEETKATVRDLRHHVSDVAIEFNRE